MIEFDFGDLVLVPFPFLDLRTKKRRPALILSPICPRHLPPFSVVAMITSQLAGERLPGDFLVKDWESSRLLHPSKIRLSKVVSVENRLIDKKIGELGKKDLEECQKAFREVFPLA